MRNIWLFLCESKLKSNVLNIFNIKIWLNYTFGPHFRNKISIWSLDFFYLNLVLFWKIWFNQVFSVSGAVTTLKGVSRVSSWIFWIVFEFFEKFKNLTRVKLILYHVIVTMSRVTLMLDVISSFSIWSLYFNFCLNLVPIFVKILQFCPSPNWNKN